MRKEQRAALQHALDALGDGSGHEVWGPGIVGHKLWMAEQNYAARAFDDASITLMRLHPSDLLIGAEEQRRFIANMRTLAPVLFDILLPPEQ